MQTTYKEVLKLSIVNQKKIVKNYIHFRKKRFPAGMLKVKGLRDQHNFFTNAGKTLYFL